MKYLTLFLFCLLLACSPDTTDKTVTTGPFTLGTQVLQQDKLLLYPITASAEFIATQAAVAEYQSLDKALTNDRFRIVEHQPFGRFVGRDAVNRLTVENRSDRQVFLMGGDIVQGGRQDRVIAEDAVIAARNIKNIDVFCVEKGRSSYHEPTEEASATDDIYAFKGYYHIAPSRLRQAIDADDQDGVWKTVSQITDEHAATNATEAFAGLEASADFTADRDAYLAHFKQSYEYLTQQDIVGWVAVSGEEIIGWDVFGHPALADARYEALLHSYITEALTFGSAVQSLDDRTTALQDLINRQYNQGAGFRHGAYLVHLSNL